MIRTRPCRIVVIAVQCRSAILPITTHRSSSLVWVGNSTRSSSSQMAWASMKSKPCLIRLTRLFLSSNSNSKRVLVRGLADADYIPFLSQGVRFVPAAPSGASAEDAYSFPETLVDRQGPADAGRAAIGLLAELRDELCLEGVDLPAFVGEERRAHGFAVPDGRAEKAGSERGVGVGAPAGGALDHGEGHGGIGHVAQAGDAIEHVGARLLAPANGDLHRREVRRRRHDEPIVVDLAPQVGDAPPTFACLVVVATQVRRDPELQEAQAQFDAAAVAG